MTDKKKTTDLDNAWRALGVDEVMRVGDEWWKADEHGSITERGPLPWMLFGATVRRRIVDYVPKGDTSTGVKHDTDKPRWDLLPFEQVEKIVHVLTDGAKKYSDDNWKEVPDGFKRYFSAALRHLAAYGSGEKFDPESKHSHLAHAGCNILFLLWFETYGEQ